MDFQLSDDKEMPKGRLRALCPDGDFSQEPVGAYVRGLCAQKHWRDAISLQDLDLLAVRGIHNTVFSPLCRLPDNVLVDIMGRLDWLDVLCLRHTSRIFLRLFCRDEFAVLHDKSSGLFCLPTPWTCPALPTHDQNLWKSMCQRLRGEACDASCSSLSTGSRSEGKGLYMHCDGCQVDHPAHLFSATQRLLRHGRVCVAHEGHVRLCKHKTVKLSTVLDCLPGRRIQNKYKRYKRPRSHQRVDGNSNEKSNNDYCYFYDFQGQSSDYDKLFEPPILAEEENGQDSLTHSSVSNLSIVCGHASHWPKHHRREWNEKYKKPPSPPPSDTSSSTGDISVGPALPLTPPPSPPLCGGLPAGVGTEFPSFIVHDKIVRGTRYKVITWSYTAHMNLEGLGDADNRGAITAQTFRECLQRLRKGHSPARYIAPEDHPGILPELRCVDPNRCGCLFYPGFSPGNKTGLNKNSRLQCNEHQVTRALYSRVSDIDNIRVRLESCDCQEETRCLKIIYTRTIRLQGFYIDPAPNWTPALFRGQRMSDADINHRLQDSFRNASVPYGWYQALDPLSYGLLVTEDKDAAIDKPLWCRGKRCKWNLSFLRENYVAGQEMNASCAYGCRAGPWSHGCGLHLGSFELSEREKGKGKQIER